MRRFAAFVTLVQTLRQRASAWLRRGAIAPRARATLEELEPRLLYSADSPLALLADGVVSSIDSQRVVAAAQPAIAATAEATAAEARREIVFIDSRVPDASRLADALMQQRGDGAVFDIVTLDAAEDGIAQINRALASRHDLAAIHIISHGSDGVLEIGSTRLDAARLAADGQSVARWGEALGADGDLLLYGCDVAQTAQGRAFVEELARLTSAEVAASTNATGSTDLGGDWKLELATGQIETPHAIATTVQDQWSGLLAISTFQQGASGYTGSQDTEIRASNAATSYGSNATITVDADDGGGATQGLIRFDNIFGAGAGQIPLGATINSASLTLYATDPSVAGAQVALHRMLVDWSEASTWNTLGGGVQTNDVEANSSPDSTLGSPTATGAQTFTGLADALQAWSDGESNHGWIVKNNNADGWDFASSEHATSSWRPQLTVNYTVGASNTAPELAGANDLAPIAEDAASNPGTLVSALIAGHFSDVDPDALQGIAVVAVNNANGAWQYSTNGGGSWTAFGTPSAGSARLLAADADTYVRFVPNANWNGTVSNGLSFHAWDQTSGTAGDVDDLLTTRTVRDQFGSTSYSNNNGSATWAASWVESDSSGGGASSGNIRVSAGQLRIEAKNTSDWIYRQADLSAATTATLSFNYTNSLGSGDRIDIQVSANGGASYTTLASFTSSSNTGSGSKSYDISSYIASNSRIRFNVISKSAENSLYVDNVQLLYNGGASNIGGASAFSSTAASSSITVSAVNDPPVATIVPATYAASEQTTLVLHGTGLSIADDAGAAAIRATLTVDSGVLNAAAGTTGVTVSGSGTGSVTLDGTLTQINNLLAGSAGGTLSFIHNSDNPPASALLTLTAFDLGNSGSGGALSHADTATINIATVNDAPVLTGANNLTGIAEDPASNPGTLVSDLIAGRVSDADTGAVQGIAVTAVDNANGAWQYSTNGGGSWTAFGTPSTGAARLLAADASTYVRFVPNANWNGTVTNGLSFHAWDRSSGSAGGTADMTAIRTVLDQFASASYSNNHGSGSWTGSWVESDTGGGGATGGNILVTGGDLRIRASNTSDWIYRQADLSGANSATLTFDYTNSLGSSDRVDLQVSANGGASYTTLASFTNSSNTGSGSKSYDISAYIASNTRIRFNVLGQSANQYLYLDEVKIAFNGGAVSAGGSTPYSAASASSSITVSAVNDPPVATIVPATYAASEQTTLILHGTGLSIADVDAGGAAIRATLTVDSGVLNAAAGTTGVTVSGSGTGSVTLDGTLTQINNLLAGSAGGTLSFIHNSDNPPASALLTLTAFDLGNSGSGGALSHADTATIHITAVNDAPVLSGANNLTGIAEDPASNPGTLVSDLIAGRVSDADTGAVQGIAVTAVDNANGAWQYSTNGGGSWTAFGTPSTGAARLLAADASTYVRFVPNANWNGTVTNGLSFHAWDRSSGSAGGTADMTAIRTVLDQFASASYSNNHGSGSWTGSWVESDTGGGGATGGNILVTGGDLRIRASNTSDWIYRQADLSGANSATLTFDYTNSLGSSDRVDLQVSANGGASYTTLASFTNSSNTGSGSKSYDISAYIASNTRIRFNVLGQSANQYLYLDEVKIAFNGGAVSAGGSTPYSAASASSSITVSAVNDPPVATIVPATYAASEQTTLVLHGTGLSIADVDAGGAAVRATLTVDSGVLNATAGTTGVTVSGSGTGSVTLDGTLTQINNLLAGSAGGTLSFFHASEAPPASVLLTLTADDLGNSGSGGSLTHADTATINIAAVNDAPALTGANNLSAIAEDPASNPGTLVSALLAGRVSDIDGPAQGIAVTGVINTNGAWQYSTNGGGSWTAFGTPSTGAARLLAADASTYVRFVPNANWNGTVSNGLTFYAWDQSSGTAGGTGDMTAIRTVLDQFASASYANNNGSGSWTGSWVESDSSGSGATGGNIWITSGQLYIKAKNSSDWVYRQADLSGASSATLSFSYNNTLSSSSQRIDVQVSGNGGSTWTTLASFTTSANTGSGSRSYDISAFIASNTRVRFDIVNSSDNDSTLRIDNLQVAYNGGALQTGGSTAYSTTSASSSITVTAVNDAPVLAAASPTLPTITEDDINNTGRLISTLLGATVTDADAGAVQGIAITTLASGNGQWQYSTNAGTSWNAVGTVSASSALLLRSTDYVRFVPDGMNATSASFTYRAWDQTSGSVGTKVNASVNGGSTAFSTGSNTASITVTALNDAPTLATGALAAVNEDTASPAGQTVATIFSGKFADVDSGSSFNGIAVVGNSANAGTQGTWQYSTNSGTNWYAIGSVADNATALAVSTTTLIRFVPVAHFNGAPPDLTVRALDNTYAGSFTANATRVTVNTTTNGGTTAIAGTTTALTTTITAVNDMPVGTANAVATGEDTPYVFTVADFGFTDPNDAGRNAGANALLDVRITTLPGAGSLTNNAIAVTAGQYVSAADIAAGKLVFTPVANASGSPYTSFTFQVRDDGGTANGGVNQDSTARTLTINVTAVNDAPVNTVPGAQNTALNTARVFSAGNGNQISISDVDAGASTLRLTLTVANGTLTLSGVTGLTFNAGANGTGAMTFTGTLTNINNALNGLSFAPTTSYTGSTLLTISSDDQGNTGSGGAMVANSSVVINVAYPNVAPVLSGANNPTAINEDQFTNAGTLVSALIAGQVSDGNGDALFGIAVTNVVNSNGVWQYSTTGGSSWTAFTGPTTTSARLLAADANTLVRFVPNANWNGTVTNGITFRAWDRTSGASGGTADSTVNGGSTAFSTATASASLTVNSINDAPVLDPSKTPVLATINEDAVAPSGPVGTLVSALVDIGGPLSNVSDIDSGAQAGIAVTGASTANGSWHYSIDNGATWAALGTVSDASARLLWADAGTRLYFQPSANYHGSIAAAITFRAWDRTGAANGDTGNASSHGGTTAFSTATDTAAITVNPVNDAPVSAHRTVATAEDTPYVFALGDFAFSDPNDSPANTFINVRITSLPASGGLFLNDTAVSANQLIAVADISAGLLEYRPATNANGAASASFGFQVQDNGGTANGGVDFSAARTITVDITAVNDAPAGTDTTVTAIEDTPYSFTAANFGFSDAQDAAGAGGANSLLSVRISSLPGTGSLTLSGVAVNAGDYISLANINAGNLRYAPPANVNGSGVASFGFQVRDNGGTANGGVDLDPDEREMTIDVTPVNDAPVGADRDLDVLEDTPYAFSAADFDFSDPVDAASAAGAHALAGVRITSLPSAGSLTLGGAAVGAGQLVSIADINAGRLTFTAATHVNGAGYASFTFQVQDDGGTANGGVDLDPTPRTLTIGVLAVNDAPVRSAGTVNNLGVLEDSGLTTLGLGGLTYGSGGGADESAQVLTITVTAVPAAGLGNVVLADGVTVVTPGIYTLAQLQGMRFSAAPDANGGPAIFSWMVQDDGGADNGGADSLAESLTITVTAVNDAPTGAVTVDGAATEGEELSAVTDTIADADGLGSFAYQWQHSDDGGASWANVDGANGATYLLGQTDVGKRLRVNVSYVDGQGNAESLTSAQTAVIANVNDAPDGLPVITGVTTEDQVLGADTAAIEDVDGLGSFAFQWQRSTDGGTNWADIGGATASTYTLGDADVSTVLRVNVSYTDAWGTAESLTSTQTAVIANVNDAPGGAPVITGTATEDQVVAADTASITDADGLGAFAYQWQRSSDGGSTWDDIDGATASSYALGDADAGRVLRVNVSYTDGWGTAESINSAPSATIANVNDAPTGAVTVTGTATEDQVLTADTSTIDDDDGLNDFAYQWQRSTDGGATWANVGGANDATYTLGDADVDHIVRVVVSYTDGQGTLESLASAQTAPVANVNDAPSGEPVITGTTTEDQVLSADTSSIADADGLGSFAYQWQRSSDGGTTWADVAGATASTFALGQADVGQVLRVVVSYTDARGNAESVSSVASATVANVNDAPVGTVTISGTAAEDQLLSASNDLSDEDGIGSISYSWRADGVAFASGASVTLGQAQVGKAITVVASYTDAQGTAESVSSAATTTVANVNDAPIGTVTISGTAAEDQILTASNDLTDEDGLGTISYSWRADGVAFASGTSVTLGQAQVGKVITVIASYTDAYGTAESVTSAATAIVANVNDAPVGAVTISGTAAEDQLLTASNDLADEDGIGSISYSWRADGVAFASGTSVTLGQAQVGKAITVVASYTDAQGAAESVTSAATAIVANVNDAPVGAVTISGTAAEDQTLTASNDLADEDGIGSISYSWRADGVAFAAGTSVTLGQAQVGKAITVVASYTDGQGTAESVTSAATATVANVNDLPTGTVTISGSAVEDQLLTASNDLADEDGIGTISYSWRADGVEFGTGASVMLGQAQVGKAITVIASYTDAQGTLESVTSAATATVANVNDAPIGTVTISGTAAEDQTLTASNDLTDEDGIGSISYSWRADGVEFGTGASVTLGQAQVGKAITVIASYTDGQGTAEAVSSAATAAVANVNDAPVGTATISGTAAEDQTLTASNDLTDEDGIGSISYSWRADGVEFGTGTSVTLGQAQVGKVITVIASYTDGQGTAEAVASAATALVTNVNDAPVGTATISGTAAEDQTLTASNDLTDEDGIGSISYSWRADGVEFGTGTSVTLGQAQVGKAITVIASYTDAQGTAEAVSSAATALVTNVNDAPVGTVSISGTAAEDQLLTASNDLTDEDGLGSIGYSWRADGVEFGTGTSVVLGQAQVGKAITVVASYTDAQGTNESVASAATAIVANVNDAPVGTVTISGTAAEDQTLTASNDLTDEDGLGSIGYSWRADGVEFGTGTSVVLGQAQVGKAITVVASYTDAHGTAESVTSAATATVTNVNDAPVGTVTISGTAAEDQTLTASNDLTDEDGIGTISYSWRADGIEFGTGVSVTLGQAQVGKVITVVASYTDAQGTNESVVSAATAAVANVNDAPIGTVSISGVAEEDQTLTASNDLSDEDGIGTIGYSWRADGVEFGTGASVTLGQAQVGKVITVVASYTDAQGTNESVVSAATAAVANVNDAPIGTVSISGVAEEDQTLTASNDLSDEDGIGTIGYSWRADGVEFGTGASVTLGQAQVGKVITVVASYTDAQGTNESVVSAATAAVANINDAPVGTVSISGVAEEDQTLTASNDLSDEDGIGTIGYSWRADGVEFGTGASVTLGQAQVGKVITVVASYTDAQGTNESVVSAATAAVANVNDAPIGTVSISGVAEEDQTLTASNDLSDEDGIGTIGYSWRADGVEFGTGASVTLGQAQVGKVITVVASYTDAQGTNESVVSAATAAVANINDAPVGTVTISGTAAEDQTLTASNDLSDEDGIGTIGYSWRADGVEFGTGASVTLGQAQVGKVITVVASYTDAQGTNESVVSAATAAVANVNDAPIGTVSISGVAEEDQTLTASNDLSDEDGIGTIGYSWRADGVEFGTGASVTLGQAQVGKVITVVASYTDAQGTNESVVSAATAAVANVNDAPVGTVSISGVAEEDQTLTASNDLSDEDGIGTIGYSWRADGVEFGTGASVTLGQAQVGKVITVVASYTDAQGTNESVVSAATAAVANVNDAPIGTVSISGVAEEDQTLTASNDLSDEDGIGTIGYSWRADGVEFGTGASVTLGQAQVGKVITVVASYTDAQGTNESVVSAATAAVANVNDAPIGTVSISGVAEEDQTLTASNDLSDEDGLGPIGYSWRADGVEFGTGASVTLGQAQVGKVITVVASYTDAQGTNESVVSAATAAVANVNDAPVLDSASLALSEGQTVTLSGANFGVTDPDNSAFNFTVSAVSGGYFQLSSAAGTPITSFTSAQLSGGLVQFVDDGDEVAPAFSVTVNDGALDSNTLAATIGYTPVNDAPVLDSASLTISEGQTVTLSGANFGISDPDNTSFTFTVSAVSGGYFQLSSAAGTPITTFTSAQLSGGLVQFVDNGDEVAPAFSVTVNDGALDSSTLAATIGYTPVNDAPVLDSASLTLSEGQTVTLSGANFGISDPDNTSFTFTVSAVSGGYFQLSSAAGTPITTFTSAQLSGGLVQFVDDGDEVAPAFSITVNDGSLDSNTLAASISYTAVNDAPVLDSASLTLREGQTVTLSGANFGITDPDSASFTFTVSAVSGGYFQHISAAGTPINSFSSTQLSGGLVQFVDDGDEVAPSFSVTVNDGSLDSNTLAASIGYTPVNDAPTTNTVTLAPIAEDSGARLITQAELLANASDIDGPGLSATNLVIASGSGSLVSHGNGTWSYTPALNDDTAVSFSYTVTDGSLTAAGSATLAITPVNDAPTLTTATLTLKPGQSLVLNSTHLRASDPDSLAASLAFIVTEVRNGHFEWVSTPGVAILRFTQADVSAGLVRFVATGTTESPTFRVAVFDGQLSSAAVSVNVLFNRDVIRPADTLEDPRAVSTGSAVSIDTSPVEVAATSLPSSAPALTAASRHADLLMSEQGIALPDMSVDAFLRAARQAHATSPETNGAHRAANDPDQTIHIAADDYTIAMLQIQYLDPAQQSRTSTPRGPLEVDLGAIRAAIDERSATLTLVETAQITGLALTAGTVWWALRAGTLLTGLLVSLPAWRHADLLAVLPDDDEEDWDLAEDDEAARDEHAARQLLDPAGEGELR